MASFNVWTANRVFMAKVRPPKQVMSSNGGSFVKNGALRLGVFEKSANGWAISNFSRNSITFEPSEIGRFLIPEKTSWEIKKMEKLFPENSTGNSQQDLAAAQVLQKVLLVNINPKTEAALVNLQVSTPEGEELHNVSADLDLGSWLSFKEIAKASIPLLCGFDASLIR